MVTIAGRPVARRGELTEHGGVITTGAGSVLIGGPSTPAVLDSPLGPLEVVPDGQSLRGNQVTRNEYLRLWAESKLPDKDWGGWDVLQWKAPESLGGDGGHLRDYKDQWIRDHATSIAVSARMNDLPPLLVAGTAWREVGGDPGWADPLAHEVRSGARWIGNNVVEPVERATQFVDEHDGGASEGIGDRASDAAGFVDRNVEEPVGGVGKEAGRLIDAHDYGASEWLGEHVGQPISDAAGSVVDLGKSGVMHVTRPPELTSAGDVSIQIRRAASILGLDPAHLSYEQRNQILNVLKNDQNNLLISTMHLKELSQVDFAGQPIVSDEQIRIISTRYNRGPELSRAAIEGNTGYGDAILRSKDHLLGLLAAPTATQSAGAGPQPVARGLVPV